MEQYIAMIRGFQPPISLPPPLQVSRPRDNMVLYLKNVIVKSLSVLLLCDTNSSLH